MGHIVKNVIDYQYFSNKVEQLYAKSVNKSDIEEIVEMIVPRDQLGNPLIKTIIKEKGRETGIFYPESESLVVSVDKLNDWLNFNSRDLAAYYNENHIDLIKAYLILMALTHETEHAYQYLIAEGKVEAPCVMLQQGYKTLFDLMKKPNYILPHPIKQTRRAISLISYYKNQNSYILERNAQFDSLSLLWEIAFHNDHDKICCIFEKMKNTFAVSGYVDNADGTLVNTYKKIYMKDKLESFIHDYEDIDMITRYRLGLPVDENTRGRILNLKR